MDMYWLFFISSCQIQFLIDVKTTEQVFLSAIPDQTNVEI